MFKVSGSGDYDTQSRTTRVSQRSLSKKELTKFFGEKKNVAQDDDVKSRISTKSRFSRGSGTAGYKAKFMAKMEE